MNEVVNETRKEQTVEGVQMDVGEDNALNRLRNAQTNIFKTATTKKWNQAGRSDPLVGPGIGGMNPGKMSMEAKMTLHSRLSINLFRGRKGDPQKNIRPIIGLARFGRQVAMVWTASAQDDPFADQTLINIEVAFEEAESVIKSRLEKLGGLIDGTEEFEVTTQSSEKPVVVELKFYSPWAFRASMLLKKFDELVCKALTARHLGLFTDDDWRSVVHDSQRALRHMFSEVNSWVSTGVKREDMEKGTRIATRATATYTELKNGYLVLDSDVIEGLHRAKLSPTNKILQERLERKQREAMEASAKKNQAATESGRNKPEAADGSEG